MPGPLVSIATVAAGVLVAFWVSDLLNRKKRRQVPTCQQTDVKVADYLWQRNANGSFTCQKHPIQAYVGQTDAAIQRTTSPALGLNLNQILTNLLNSAPGTVQYTWPTLDGQRSELHSAYVSRCDNLLMGTFLQTPTNRLM